MLSDPAASYRHRTERMRAASERRYAKDAAAVTARFIGQQAAEKKRARMTRILQAATMTLASGVLKSEPLTPDTRAAVEAIAEEARTYLGGEARLY